MESILKDLMLRVARLERQADLNPPLGSQPPCQALSRAKGNGADIQELMWVKNTLNNLPLSSSSHGVKMLKDVKRRDADRFYKMTYPRPIFEESDSTPIKKKRKPFIEAFEISSHTQFRMDLRGITVRHIDLALRDFQKRGDSQGRIEKAEEAEKSWGLGSSWGLSKRELDALLGEKKKIKHECKVRGRMLTIWFIPMSRKGGKVVSIKTAFWSGADDPTLGC